MSGACIPGREVVLRLRHRTKGTVKLCSVVCPSRWSKGQLLKYARRHHPQETVVIDVWKSIGSDDDPWHPRLWIVHPAAMADQ